MAQEVLDILVTDPDGSYVDCTAGQGGHTSLILERLSWQGKVTAVDCDPLAIENLSKRFANEPRVTLVRSNFARIGELVAHDGFSGAFLDLGFSSTQVDGEAGAALSFKRDEPLDMRIDPDMPLTAAEIVNTWEEKEIARVLKDNADERHARRIASRIVRERVTQSFRTTLQLRDTVASALAGVSGKWRRDPATRTFLALRIEVNREFASLAEGLEGAFGALKKGGRLAVLTYHSGEDRIVKKYFRQLAADKEVLDERRGIARDIEPLARDLTRKGLRPSDREVSENPRSRSAVLRAVEKVA